MIQVHIYGREEHAYATITDDKGGWLCTVKPQYAEAVKAAIEAANANGGNLPTDNKEK